MKREILPSCFFKEKACNGTQALAINKSMVNIKQKTRSEAGLEEGLLADAIVRSIQLFNQSLAHYSSKICRYLIGMHRSLAGITYIQQPKAMSLYGADRLSNSNRGDSH